VKTIAIHSYKGGVGKTTVAMLLAKHAAPRRKVCVIDLDFIGSGMVDLYPLEKAPALYVDSYYLGADPHAFDAEQLLGRYGDQDISGSEIATILNVGKGWRRLRRQRGLDLEDQMLSMVANEPNYGEVELKTRILLEKLADQGFELAIIDCHPGLAYVSESVMKLTDADVFLATPNRGDSFGLLKKLNLKKLDQRNAILIVNRAESPVTDAKTLRLALEDDTLVGAEAQALFPHLKYLAVKPKHTAFIPESELLRRVFYLGETGFLPRIQPKKPEFQFCDKVLALV